MATETVDIEQVKGKHAFIELAALAVTAGIALVAMTLAGHADEKRKKGYLAGFVDGRVQRTTAL